MSISRRAFVGAASFSILPSTVFGQSAPSNTLRIAQIGCGRIARDSEFAGLLRHHALARYVAVCDLDSVRAADARQLIEASYERSLGAGKYDRVATHANYKELLADKSIDAVCISTPDHWHAQPAMEAALAGKDIYLQKPASLTIAEGRQMAGVLKRTGRILQVGSQQRSDVQFRLACELIRNGRLGKIQDVFIGLPEDPAGVVEPEMPVPANLNYEMWLGSTPLAYYTENRVHPQTPDIRKRYARPGWLRCEQFGAGMITGWGAHHIDIAHWAMDTELTGPIEISATAQFPQKGLWDVHGPYHVRQKYANGATVYISEKYPTGLRFVGEKGWIWVTRGASAPGRPVATLPGPQAFDASDRRIITEGIKDNELHLHTSPQNDHHLDWLTSIHTRKEPASPAEVSHRSCSACLLAQVAMHLGRSLQWDPAMERFVNDEEANRHLTRPQRAPYGTAFVRQPA
ncbi:MAG: Gfo/Idh/MocA family oxidoreductase [Candidatus Solibacter sp.]